MKIKYVFAIVLLVVPAWCGTIVPATARGWVVPGQNNGASASNSFILGGDGAPEAVRDWFQFAIPSFGGANITAANLDLDQPAAGGGNPPAGHLGGTFTVSFYALAARPLTLTDVTNGTLYGSVITTLATDGTTLVIPLNSAALIALNANQGGNFFIGGISSAEGVFENWDFAFSEQSNSVLDLTTAVAAAPEPATMLFSALGLAAMIASRRLRRSPEA